MQAELIVLWCTTKVRLMALLANIRLAWKCLLEINALAYFAAALMAKKTFCEIDSRCFQT
jgi:hypothetical protein